MTDYALTNYPLADAFRSAFEQTVGCCPEYLTISELRRLPVVRMVRKLRSLRAARLFIVLENEHSGGLLPVYYSFSGLIPSRSTYVVRHDLSRQPLSRWQAFRALLAVAGGSLAGMRRARRCRGELTQLLGEPRMAVRRSDSKRVLYLKTNLWFGVTAGGSIGHVAGVVNGLLGLGYTVDYLGVEPPPLVKPQAVYHEVKPPKAYAVPYELNLYRFHDEFVKSGAGLKPDECGFIYQRMSIGNYTGVVLSRRCNVPLVLEYNGSEVWAAKSWGAGNSRYHDLALMCEDVCLRHAHVIVTVSDVLREELIARGVAPERIACYPNCIEPETFDPRRFTAADIAAVRQQWGIAADARVAGFVGTFGQWHGVDVLAQAVRALVEQDTDWLRRQRLHFLIVGDGLKMPEVRAALADERCKPFYTLTGLVPQKEAPAYLASMDLLLSPHVPNADGSRFFGSPTKLFEYMAMERPIIASDLEQIGQVLQPSLRVEELPAVAPVGNEGYLSLLTAPGDAAALARSIRFLVEHPDWGSVLAQNAGRVVRERYTWDRHVAAALRCLDAVD